MHTLTAPRTGPAILALVLVISAIPNPVSAHIVPPENFHPVAEAYRRMTFMLNLNPVLWEEVMGDTGSIEKEIRKVSIEDADAYGRAMAEYDARVGETITPSSLRKETARGIFSVSTKAVARTILLHLEIAEENLNDYQRASNALEG